MPWHYADRKHQIIVGEYRKTSNKFGIAADQIPSSLDALTRSYEKKKKGDLDAVLDFHVRFEKIHPFTGLIFLATLIPNWEFFDRRKNGRHICAYHFCDL